VYPVGTRSGYDYFGRDYPARSTLCPCGPAKEDTVAKNLYVGNMAFSTTEDQLREVFSQYGTVTKVQVIMDRETGRPRGFAFVEMSDGGDQAIAALNGAQLDGRTLTVNEAKPREGGGGGGGRGGHGGGGGGYGGGGRGGYGGGRRY
jgi:RNA recognition motif-containing protein